MRGLLLAALFAACSAQFFGNWKCSFYTIRDCSREAEHPECGSDGKTYRNRCEFTKAQCSGLNIDVSHYGKCDGRPTTGGPVITGEAAVLDYFCAELSHEDCPADKEMVCGSNDKTYANMCEYEKAKCTHRDLTVKSFGACST